MNRIFTYGALSFLLFLGGILPNLFRPNEGMIFLLEEVIGIILLVLGLLIFFKPIRKIINRLNVTHTWEASFLKRMSRTLIYLSIASLLVGSLLTASIYIYTQQLGTPKAYQKIVEHKQQIEQGRVGRSDRRPPRPPQHRPERPIDDGNYVPPLSSYAFMIFGGSFVLFGLLFGTEELFDFNERINNEKFQKEALLKEQALMKASVLQKQLNPHFMFNTLNVLSGLIHEDIDKSERFIKELSQIYRYSLEHSEAIVSTLKEEIAYIQSYFFLLKIRFEEKLHYTIDVPINFLDSKIPTLTLEVLVENAVKHNVADNASPLTIEIFIENDCLIVKNNLQIRKDSVSSHGVGLSNLVKRLELLGITNASFKAEEGYFLARVPLIDEALYFTTNRKINDKNINTRG